MKYLGAGDGILEPAGGLSNPRPLDYERNKRLTNRALEEYISNFKDYLIVNQNLREATVKNYISHTKRMLKAIGKHPLTIVEKDIQEFLKGCTVSKRHFVLAVRVFFGRYLKKKELSNEFKLPAIPFKPKFLPSKKELQDAYHTLNSQKQKTIFLLLATSGLRLHEALELEITDIDLDKCMIKPKNDNNSTKRSWVTFFNREAKQALETYIKLNNIQGGRLFAKGKPYNLHVLPRDFPIKAKVLREWFCSEMGRLGVPDRYIDAFCGRIPRSILARHYTDYSPDRLKEIYDKAGLNVLS